MVGALKLTDKNGSSGDARAKSPALGKLREYQPCRSGLEPLHKCQKGPNPDSSLRHVVPEPASESSRKGKSQRARDQLTLLRKKQ